MEMLIIFRLESESHYLQHMNHKTFDSSFLKLIKLCLEYAFYFGITHLLHWQAILHHGATRESVKSKSLSHV